MRWNLAWTDALFALALANAVFAAGLSLFPDSRAAHAVGLHSLDVPSGLSTARPEPVEGHALDVPEARQ